LTFLNRFSKNTQTSNFIKIRPIEPELFYADEETDMIKLTVTSYNFVNAPKTDIQNNTQ